MSTAIAQKRASPLSQHPLDLRVLGQYLTVCQTLNMSAAARRMNLTTPAVSQIIHRLENDLGVVLFERTPQGLRLTPAGALLRERAESLIEIDVAARQELGTYHGRLVPSIKLYLLDAFAVSLVNTILPDLTRIARTVEVLSGRSLTHIRDFVAGDIDILISSNDFSDLPRIECHRLCRQELIAVAPASVPPEQRTLTGLAGTLPLIRFRKGSRIDDLVETYVEDQALDLPRAIECGSAATTLQLVAGGNGWTIATPLMLAWFRDRWQDLAFLPLPPPVAAESLYLVTAADKFLDLPTTLARRCREALAAERRAWEGSPATAGLAAMEVDPP